MATPVLRADMGMGATLEEPAARATAAAAMAASA